MNVYRIWRSAWMALLDARNNDVPYTPVTWVAGTLYLRTPRGHRRSPGAKPKRSK